jgi:Uma2 family endonuclease
VPLKWENIKNHWEESIVMSVIVAKWTIDEYHRMIDAGILSDRKVELLQEEIVEMSPEEKSHAYSSGEAGDYPANLLAA